MRTSFSLGTDRQGAQHAGRNALVRAAIICAILVGSAAPAFAQLDPLLFLKSTKPNVLLVVDTANRMQRDADDDYYDQFIYSRTGATWEGPIGVSVTTASRNYRRKYVALRNLDTSLTADKFEANTIVTVGDLQAGFSTFDARTRMAIARAAMVRAITLNQYSVRFGLVKMRQMGAALGVPSPANSQLGNEGPVKNDDPNQYAPTDLNLGKWHIMRPTVTAPNNQQTTSGLVCGADAGCNTALITYLGRRPEQGGLIPAGQDALNYVDAPVRYMLDDAKSEATRLIDADTMARNTVVVLIVGGGEGSSGLDPAAAALSFKSVSSRRVPIYVIAIAPPAGDVTQLQSIAWNSGGQYVEITKAMIENAFAAGVGSPVPQIVRAINTAVQHSFASFGDFNTAPTPQLPYGPSTEYQVTSPIVGTVNLDNGHDINGNTLPNTVILKGLNVIPQRSNVMVTTGFALPGPVNTPGFPGRLRAFRVYRPEPDSTKTAGYKFVGDGTALWVARVPTDADGTRNSYTALHDGTMVPFTTDNAATLRPYLNDVDVVAATRLINYVRGLPLGAFVDSTPAFLDAPSLDPPPDADYPGFKDLCEGRRTLIFIGGNDGMLHAIDGRTGVEVWAFIPTNLLPKLRALREGQPVDGFRFFADGSAKLADVKIAGQWRTYMVFGEGPGGTYYQTVDVTMANMASRVAQDSDDVSTVLSYFNSATIIPFKWSFPTYANFDFGLSTAATPYGDVSQTAATAIEKSVGQTWSDPAVGQVISASGSWVTLVGSGFLPYSQQHQANRADVAAGTTFYVLNMATGAVLDSRDVGNDGSAENIDNCAVAGDCTKQKNAVQSDPVATGPQNSRFVDTVYIADLDGRLWRFGLGLNASNAATISSGPTRLFKGDPTQPLFSSMAVVNVGGKKQYIFFGSGSDLLPSTGVNQPYYLYGVLDDATGKTDVTPSFAMALEKVDGLAGDEKVSAYPAVAGDIVFFTTTTFKPGTPTTTLPDANVYAFTFIGGPAYDNTGDDTVTGKDTPKVKTITAGGRATAPFVADQHLVLAVGGKVEVFGDPQDFNNGVGQVGVRILSWREIR